MRFSFLLITATMIISCPATADEISVQLVDQRQPIPSQETRTSTRGKIQSIFEVTKAKSREEKRKLAKQLLQTANDTANDPAARFVMMNLARETSEQSGDIDGAMAAIDGIISDYQADESVLRLTALRDLSRSTGLLSREKAAIKQAGLKLLADYEAADEYAKAVTAAKMMIVVGKQIRDLPMATKLQTRVVHLETIAAEHKPYLAAVAELRLAPEKAEANDTVGRFLAFRKGQWKAGMPHLAKSNHQGLAQVAQLEITAKDPAQFKQLAKTWSTLADTWDDSVVQNLMWARSAAFYQQALGKLSGLSRLTTQRELDALLAKGVAPMNVAEGTVSTNNTTSSVAATSTSDYPVLNDFIYDLRWAEDGDVIDLLPWVRFPEDVIAGSWQKSSEGHLVSPKTDISRIRLPAMLPAEYDVEMDVVPVNSDFAIMLFTPMGTRFYAVVEGYGTKIISGLNYIDGKNLETNQTRHLGQVLKYGESNRMEVSVRRTGILFKVNGKQICHYRDNFARLGVKHLAGQSDFPPVEFYAYKSALKIRLAKVTVHRDSRTPFPRYPSSTKGRSFWYAQKLTKLHARYSLASQVYLDDIPEISFHSGNGVVGKRGRSGAGDGESFTFNRQRYKHALWMHPSPRGGTSRIAYNLDGQFKKFSAEVGICEADLDSIGSKIDGELTFQVFGDGKLIASVPDLKVRGSKLLISADVSGVKTLTLRAVCHGKARHAYGAWLNPVVTR